MFKDVFKALSLSNMYATILKKVSSSFTKKAGNKEKMKKQK